MFSFALKPISAYPSLDILFYRVFFAAAILLLYAYAFNRRKMKMNFQKFSDLNSNDQNRTVILTLFGGLLLTANWFVFIYVTNHISIKSAAYAYMICPILATLLGYFILREKLLKHQWISVTISIASIILLLLNNVTDVLYSLIVAISYALYLISQRKNNLVDKLPILTYQMVFSSIILLCFYPTYSSPLPNDTKFYFLIILIAILFTILPLLLNLFAIEGLSSATVGVLLYINPILNFIVAVFVFHEHTSLFQVLSYCLVFISIIIFNLSLFHKRFSPKVSV